MPQQSQRHNHRVPCGLGPTGRNAVSFPNVSPVISMGELGALATTPLYSAVAMLGGKRRAPCRRSRRLLVPGLAPHASSRTGSGTPAACSSARSAERRTAAALVGEPSGVAPFTVRASVYRRRSSARCSCVTDSPRCFIMATSVPMSRALRTRTSPAVFQEAGAMIEDHP